MLKSFEGDEIQTHLRHLRELDVKGDSILADIIDEIL